MCSAADNSARRGFAFVDTRDKTVSSDCDVDEGGKQERSSAYVVMHSQRRFMGHNHKM